jgi:polyadenylate-binding protein 2
LLYLRHIILYFSFAYVEFSDKESTQTALALDDSLFKGRQIKVKIYIYMYVFLIIKNFQVTLKRTNRPGVSTTDRPPRGGHRGFGRGRFPRGGAYMPYISSPYRGRIARPYFR